MRAIFFIFVLMLSGCCSTNKTEPLKITQLQNGWVEVNEKPTFFKTLSNGQMSYVEVKKK